MKNITKKTIILCAVALSTATISFSHNQQGRERQQQKRPSIKQLFKDLDSNEDGLISYKESKGPLKENFKKVDTNKDGFVSKEEMTKAPKLEENERQRN